MTATDIADAADRNVLLRLFRQIMPTVIAAAIIAGAGWLYTEHVARVVMQGQLSMVLERLDDRDAREDAADRRRSEIESRVRAVEVQASAAGAQSSAVNSRLDRIERLLERLLEERRP